MKAGFMSQSGILGEQCILPVHETLEEIFCEIDQYVKKMKEKYQIDGMGVSAPGAVDVQTGIIGGMSALPCIHGPSWTEKLEERFGVPASIENDANCAALAELALGSAKGMKDMAFVVCGTGIGGAVVINGEIQHGTNLYGGEFGCMVMRNENGELSTFSSEASTMSFVRKIQKKYPQEEWNGVKVFAEAEKGNEECRKAIDTFFYNLAEGIYNIQHVIDPQIILLGGGISRREGFAETLRKKLEEIVGKVEECAKTKVVVPNIDVCTFREDANLIGAAVNLSRRKREVCLSVHGEDHTL